MQDVQAVIDIYLNTFLSAICCVGVSTCSRYDPTLSSTIKTNVARSAAAADAEYLLNITTPSSLCSALRWAGQGGCTVKRYEAFVSRIENVDNCEYLASILTII